MKIWRASMLDWFHRNRVPHMGVCFEFAVFFANCGQNSNVCSVMVEHLSTNILLNSNGNDLAERPPSFRGCTATSYTIVVWVQENEVIHVFPSRPISRAATLGVVYNAIHRPQCKVVFGFHTRINTAYFISLTDHTTHHERLLDTTPRRSPTLSQHINTLHYVKLIDTQHEVHRYSQLLAFPGTGCVGA